MGLMLGKVAKCSDYVKDGKLVRKGCGAPVYWVPSRKGRPYPVREESAAAGFPVLHRCGQSLDDALAESAQYRASKALDRAQELVAKFATVKPGATEAAPQVTGKMASRTGKSKVSAPVKVKMTEVPDLTPAQASTQPRPLTAAEITALRDGGFSLTDIMAEMRKVS